ncbi:MAG: hypothetical protein KME49_26715 [Brasilonema octagenarum HA4186-MV1]|jgi:hypothetical protein|nr:hypothetical protein [Brasilonema octagenarum HA4186-MV1]
MKITKKGNGHQGFFNPVRIFLRLLSGLWEKRDMVNDALPSWQTLWRGWMRLQDMWGLILPPSHYKDVGNDKKAGASVSICCW